jgi:hypothetical protein
MIVVDASAMAPALLDDGPLGGRTRKILTNDTDRAAHLLTEVMSVVRRPALGVPADPFRLPAIEHMPPLPVWSGDRGISVGSPEGRRLLTILRTT